MHLTDVGVRAFKPPASGQTDFYDDTIPRFGVRVSMGGTKTFFLITGSKKQRKRHTLGQFPIISLSQAREQAKKILANRTLHGEQQASTILFKEARDKFEELHFPKLKERTRKDYKRVLDKHLANLHDMKLSTIQFEDVAAITDKLINTPREQFHVLVVGGTFFKWCVRRRYIKHNPIEGIDVPKLPTRKRVLTDEELVKVWRAAQAFSEPFRSIVLLLILTGQRRVEMASLHKTWVSHNRQTITLPDGFAKNKREHIIPLGKMALEVIGTDTPDGYYFPSGKDPDKPFTGFSKPKKQLDATLKGVAPWTLHDLRRTFSTNLSKLGVLPHIKEELLNHITAKGDVEAIYDQWRFEPEKRAAIEKWEEHLTQLFAS